MKKWYMIVAALVLVGISIGIFYFAVYKPSAMRLPDDVTMETAWGAPYSFDDLPPKVRLVEFIYTNCPDICPNTTMQMAKLRDRLQKAGVFGRDVEFVTITIDPARDTKEKLQTYANTFGVTADGQGWVFLRGSEAETKKTADAFNFQYRDPGNGMMVHTSLAYLLNRDGRVIEQIGMGESRFRVDEVYEVIMDELS
ncbi:MULTISPECIES: SCO family protein [Geobacillus]|uniref:SCO1/SenC family lipoprotein n=2 Tax=Geobacillus thermodenitrificans TaxID=33940 RepID=A4IKW0_GEOTN|nr:MULTISPECIES: SCO family protein [Geobacillus]ABO65964.1 SCO1/SenC family lipoprotein [Geobacillus thermodenitrificans NG80-2]ARP41697.1 SCO2-like protein RP587 [Geobacillus thermodenitrificans]ATO36926.1 electron transporter SenC [Geobacillus thermodenitrificans]MEC5188876.1 protein SCO1/2 [Geobacillus thermodenitrificans]MED0664127.1 SCO family protein [Geobacillus thermodenitrificans]